MFDLKTKMTSDSVDPSKNKTEFSFVFKFSAESMNQIDFWLQLSKWFISWNNEARSFAVKFNKHFMERPLCVYVLVSLLTFIAFNFWHARDSYRCWLSMFIGAIELLQAFLKGNKIWIVSAFFYKLKLNGSLSDVQRASNNAQG